MQGEHTLVLVDRDKESAALLRAALSQKPASFYHCETFWIGPHLRDIRPDVVLLDPDGWAVPVRSVVMAVTMLVKAVHKTPVYLFSGSSPRLDWLAKEFGAAGVIQKPKPGVSRSQKLAAYYSTFGMGGVPAVENTPAPAWAPA